MKSVKFGNMLDVKSGMLIHGVNCQGVMGSGIAKEVKDRFPDAFDQYIFFCQQNPVVKTRLGLISAQYYYGPGISDTKIEKVIVNGITQENFGRSPGVRYVSYPAIASVFKTSIDLACELGISEIHYPLIGAGLGGGDWSIISDIIDAAFENASQEINRTLWLFEP